MVLRLAVPTFAVIVAVVVAETTLVATLKVAAVAPAEIVTEDGTVAFVLPDDRATARPPAGAGPEMATVPVADLPPTTVVGNREMLARAGANTARLVCLVVPDRLALTVAVVVEETPEVVTVKVAEVAPAAILAEAGTDTPVPVADSATTTPPDGATRVKATVPVEDVPPVTELGETLTEESSGV